MISMPLSLVTRLDCKNREVTFIVSCPMFLGTESLWVMEQNGRLLGNACRGSSTSIPFGWDIILEKCRGWHVTNGSLDTITLLKNIVTPSLDEGLFSLHQTLRYKADRTFEVDLCSIFYKFTLESFVHMTYAHCFSLLWSTPSIGSYKKLDLII